MPYAVFIGEFELTLDDKNRMLVPSEVRRRMNPAEDGEGFYLTIGPNKKPWLFAAKFWENVILRDGAGMSPSMELRPDPKTLRLWEVIFAASREAPWDKQGRILIPELTLRRTGIKKDITLVGMRTHLQIWNQQDWEARFNENLESTNSEFFQAA